MRKIEKKLTKTIQLVWAKAQFVRLISIPELKHGANKWYKRIAGVLA